MQLSFTETEKLIPGLTEYRYYTAKKHSSTHGCAMPPIDKVLTRSRMDPVKLDSFLDFITSSHIIKDLPFGERKLKVGDGTKIETPNVIRCMGPAAIVEQYKQYCTENDLTPLGDSTMFKILSECTASMRKSLEGLDYYVAEGTRAFQELQDVLADLFKMGAISMTEASLKQQSDLLLECKRYLKTDYKVHISENSNIADHCRKYALSSLSQENFRTCCDHSHDHVCEHCEQLIEVLDTVSTLVDECRNITNKDIYQYKIAQAKDKIIQWRTHIMRSRNQDVAKSDLLETMKESEIMVVLDWAMKYLPRRYREDQSNWFAKRGLSWHIGVAFRRSQSLESLTFVHIFQNQVSRDSFTTTSVILDILHQLKDKYPETSKIHLWSDNAGCYKSADTINALAMSTLVDSYNFCEAQDGKGACDRTAETLKGGIRRFINQGHDVTNASHMKRAIESTVKNEKYIVKVVDCKKTSQSNEKSKMINIPAISSINNFKFMDEGIKVWRQYNIGEGKIIQKPLEFSVALPELQVVEADSLEIDFHSLQRLVPQSSGEASESEVCGIFTCPTDGCMATFDTFQQYEDHNLIDNCTIHPEKHSKFHKVHLYARKLNNAQVDSKNIQLAAPGNLSEGQIQLEMGWALKGGRQTKRFNEKQKDFLIRKFNIGIQTGNKEDPENVAEAMKYAENENGSRLFERDEFLTSLQISSFFSRHARKSDALRETIISDLENSYIQT